MIIFYFLIFSSSKTVNLCFTLNPWSPWNPFQVKGLLIARYGGFFVCFCFTTFSDYLLFSTGSHTPKSSLPYQLFLWVSVLTVSFTSLCLHILAITIFFNRACVLLHSPPKALRDSIVYYVKSKMLLSNMKSFRQLTVSLILINIIFLHSD